MVVADRTLAELVLEHRAYARVFQRHHIDFACAGDRTLAEAALVHEIDLRVLRNELSAALERGDASCEPHPRALQGEALLEHLTNRVHHDLRSRLRSTATLAAAVADEDGPRNGRLRDLCEMVSRLRAELDAHMNGEETILFPAIRAGRRNRSAIEDALLGMHDEHVFVGALLAQARAEAESCRVPRWASRAYRRLFEELDELEYAVLCHIHLENHVLLPRALM